MLQHLVNRPLWSASVDASALHSLHAERFILLQQIRPSVRYTEGT